jgi:sigma-70-like protein/putative zinc finger protein
VKSLSRALGKLPVRWRRVLWLTAVEGREPREMAALIGVSEAAAAALARRAREGLRLSYLLVQLRPGMPAECRQTVDRLPAYARTALPPGVAQQVTDHLEMCAFCRARSGEFAAFPELSELAEELRGALRRMPMPSPTPERPLEVIQMTKARVDRRADRRGPHRKQAIAATCVAVAVIAVALVTAVSLLSGPTSSQGSAVPPAAAGAPSATVRPSGSPSPESPMTTPPRAERAAPESIRADARRPERRAPVSAAKSSTPPAGGGAPGASSAPEPGATTAPTSSPRKVCVGLLVVRLCRGVG